MKKDWLRRRSLLARLVAISWRDLAFILLPITLVIGVGAWVAVHFIRPAPPNAIRILGGQPGSTYWNHAEKYKKTIERDGVKVQLVQSHGALDNLKMMAATPPAADVAFVQGGLTDGVDISNLHSLGSVFVQPLMVYYRGNEDIEILSRFRGKRLAVGPEGTGTRALTLKLLKANDVTEKDTQFSNLGGAEAADALVAGRIDAAFLAGDSATPEIQKRLRSTEGITLMSFRQAEAYRRRMRFLSHLTMPEGASDFGKNLPSHDIQLIGPTVELVARKDLHPALSDLLIKAAREVHGNAGLYREAGQYPSPQERDFPISPDAQRFYKSGGKFLYKNLPFWLASLVDRLMVLILPLLVLLVPATKLVPKLYAWRLRSRIYRWYGILLSLERELRADPSPAHRAEILQRLGEIQKAVDDLKLPVSYSEQLFALRDHVTAVRRRLSEEDIPAAEAASATQ
jgi:TRAP transporter TAXI family solute receptor